MDAGRVGGQGTGAYVPVAVAMRRSLRMSLPRVLTVALAAAICLLAGCSGEDHEATTHLRQAAELLRAKKIGRAREKVDAAIAAEPSRASTYYTAMAIYEATDRYGDAARIGGMLLDRAGSSKLDTKLSSEETAQLYSVKGFYHWQAGDIADAEQAYKDALVLAPDSPHLLNALGYLYADEGIKLDEALRLTRRAVKLAPNNPEIIDSLGWAQYRLGDYDAAIRTLRRAVKLMPDEAELRYHLGAAYAKRGRRTEACIELRKALILDPQAADAAQLLKTLQE